MANTIWFKADRHHIVTRYLSPEGQPVSSAQGVCWFEASKAKKKKQNRSLAGNIQIQMMYRLKSFTEENISQTLGNVPQTRNVETIVDVKNIVCRLVSSQISVRTVTNDTGQMNDKKFKGVTRKGIMMSCSSRL
jgi:hypothetical protein